MSFKELITHPEILKAIEEAGYLTPTPIQENAIPKIFEKLDLFCSAQTGTGKTAAFILPTLERLTTPSPLPGRGPRVLILVPTRELAMQVATEATKFSKYLSRVKTVCIFGGTPYPIQIRELSRPYEILVATPGRLIDHLERGRINLSRIELLILDEADRMLDMGFIEPVEEIASATPKERQTLMFSATMNKNVLKLSKSLLNNPVEIAIERDPETHKNIEQRLHSVDNLDHKYRLLDHLLNDPTLNQAIIFTATKRQAGQLTDRLMKKGRPVATLHGDMTQRDRTRTIGKMRRKEVSLLVATDVAGRGIDIQTITHVINFDLPNSAEDYVHRIGRTGRAGATGLALSFAAYKDMPLVKRIEQYTGQKITSHTIAGMEPLNKPRPESPRSSRSPKRRHFKFKRR